MTETVCVSELITIHFRNLKGTNEKQSALSSADFLVNLTAVSQGKAQCRYVCLGSAPTWKEKGQSKRFWSKKRIKVCLYFDFYKAAKETPWPHLKRKIYCWRGIAAATMVKAITSLQHILVKNKILCAPFKVFNCFIQLVLSASEIFITNKNQKQCTDFTFVAHYTLLRPD